MLFCFFSCNSSYKTKSLIKQTFSEVSCLKQDYFLSVSVLTFSNLDFVLTWIRTSLDLVLISPGLYSTKVALTTALYNKLFWCK